MNEEQLRAQFEEWQQKGIEFNVQLSEYENSFIQHRWEGFKSCANIKDAEIANLEYAHNVVLKLKHDAIHAQQEEIELLKAKIEKMRDALTRISSPQGDITKWLPENYTSDLTRAYEDCAYEALNLIYDCTELKN